MLKQGYWLFEFISISSVIHQARPKYARSFLLCETDDNDLTYFLLAQVTAILQAITNLHAYLERKAKEVAVLQRHLGGTDGLNHRQLALLRHALRHAGFRNTVLSHQSSHGISNQTARSDLQKLAGSGLLLPRKDGKRDIFCVPADLPTRLQDGALHRFRDCTPRRPGERRWGGTSRPRGQQSCSHHGVNAAPGARPRRWRSRPEIEDGGERSGPRSSTTRPTQVQ